MNSLDERLRLELEKETPDRGVVLELMASLQEEDPVKAIPVEAIKAWGKIQNGGAKRQSWLWKRVGSFAAAFAIAFVLLGVVPSAFGVENLLQRIGRWTSDLFSFGGSITDAQPDAYDTSNQGLQKVYDTLADLGVEENVVPRWIPDGYEMEELTNQDIPNGNRVLAVFSDGRNNIRLVYFVYKDYAGVHYPKDDMDAELLEYNGVKTYIIDNEEITSALWVSNNVECGVFACNKAEVRRVIMSIYGEE